MAESTLQRFFVSADAADQRLDVWLAGRMADFSRSRIQALIRSGAVAVDGGLAKPNLRLAGGECVEIAVPEPEDPAPRPQEIPLRIVYEDEYAIVIDKPAGMVTHPAPGHSDDTLVNALLHHCRDLSGIGGVRRPGIVHRLDRDTSGLLVAAKNDSAHRALSDAIKRRDVSRRYAALVSGRPSASRGIVDAPIGRSRADRLKMAIDEERGRAARTRWQVERWGPGICLLRVQLETGRTHQIRVHLARIGMPVIGDRVYGLPKKREIERVPHAASAIVQAISRVERQMLHAWALEFPHPADGRLMRFEAPLPADMRVLADLLEPCETH